MHPNPLGAAVDQANLRQEENAEAAKFIVYVHEFELNKPREESKQVWSINKPTGLKVLRHLYSSHLRGFRLNDYGMEHVVMIADAIMKGASYPVVVERSQTSKRSDTLHEYPVHFNHRLDEDRRQVVVAALQSLGVDHAEQLVVVSSAFPEGLDAQEAVQAYYSNRLASGSSSQGTSGGR